MQSLSEVGNPLYSTPFLSMPLEMLSDTGPGAVIVDEGLVDSEVALYSCNLLFGANTPEGTA